jgi:opacity protein-like surface antigen
MSKRGSMLAGLAIALMSTASASAADLGGMKGGSMKDSAYMPAMQQPAARGIYLRGDFSYANQDLGSIYEPPAYTLSQPTIESTRSFGLGVGRYFSNNVRGDLTFDWRSEAKVRGNVNDSLATVQGERVFGVKNVVALANLYYDFDTRSHFTPYIGVGLGFARNTTTAGHVNIAYPTGSNCDPAGPTPTETCSATFEGRTKTNAAGALMAGFSAKLHDRLHLDAGYRFLYLGGANTGDINIRRTVIATGVATNGGAADPIIHDLIAHEFRVGLRFDIK